MAASRFKNQSRYKNVFGQAPKREFWLQDVLGPNEFNFLGRGIAASCSHLSFCWDTPGTIALYPLETIGRLQPPYKLLHAHSAPVTDMEFSPFLDGILVTAGEDKQVKIWRIDGEVAGAEYTLDNSSRVEAVSFNPYADNVLASCSGKQLTVSDLSSQQSIFSQEICGDTLQSISWGLEGGILGAVGKDRTVRCVDPRAKEGSVVEIGTFSMGKEFQVISRDL